MTDSSTTEGTALPEDFGRTFVTLIHETLTGAEDALGDLDRRAGDGDFGTNVRVAMKGVSANIEGDSPSSYREWLTAMYMGWLGVGGTSGPLFGMFFRDLAKAGSDADGQDGTADGADGGSGGADGGGAPTLEEFAQALAAGQATIQKYGEAKVGDKTMVDALDPAVAAVKEAGSSDPVAALAAAEEAAISGARDTAEATAKRGRASYVGDAAKGVIDPGAAAMALVIGCARAAAAGEKDVVADWIA